MKIKNYLQFIKESIKEDIEEHTIWTLTEDDIRDYLLELEDNGYVISVNFGFSSKTKQYNYGTGKYTEKEVFDEKVFAGEDIKPAYWIEIHEGKSVSNEDISDTIKFAYSIIKEKTDGELTIHDKDGDIGDIEGIEIKGGLFFTDNWNSSEPELHQADDYIALFVKQKEVVKFTPKDLVEYYKWDVNLYKNDIPCVEIDLEDMTDIMLSRRSEYKDSLVKGQEYMWDYYDVSDYYPDLESMFRYEIDKENQILLIKCLIKDFGGFEKFKPLIAKYSGVSDLEKFETEDSVIDFLITQRYNTIIINIIKGEFNMNEEPLMEISDTIANWSQSAHCDDNYKEIIDEFDEIVGDEMPFAKIEKEVTKYYSTKDGERKEYKTEVTFYQIPYDNKWIEDIDSNDLFNENLNNLFREWASNQNFDYTMNPRLSDYGDVDSKKMNGEINSYLTKYLNRNN